MNIFQISRTYQETQPKPKKTNQKVQEINTKHPFLPTVKNQNAWDVKSRIFLDNPHGPCAYLGTKRQQPLTTDSFDRIKIITGGCLFSYSSLIGTDQTNKQTQMTNPSSVQELISSSETLVSIDTPLGTNQLSVNNLESVSRIQRHANSLIKHFLAQNIHTELVIDIPLAEYIIYYLDLYNVGQLSSELFLELIDKLKTYRNILKQNYEISCSTHITPQFTSTLDFLAEWLIEKIKQGEPICRYEAAAIITQNSDNRGLHQAFKYADQDITGKYSYWTPFLNQDQRTLCIQLDNIEEYKIQKTCATILEATPGIKPIGIYPLPDYEIVDQYGTHITNTFYKLSPEDEQAGQQFLRTQSDFLTRHSN